MLINMSKSLLLHHDWIKKHIPTNDLVIWLFTKACTRLSINTRETKTCLSHIWQTNSDVHVGIRNQAMHLPNLEKFLCKLKFVKAYQGTPHQNISSGCKRRARFGWTMRKLTQKFSKDSLLTKNDKSRGNSRWRRETCYDRFTHVYATGYDCRLWMHVFGNARSYCQDEHHQIHFVLQDPSNR